MLEAYPYEVLYKFMQQEIIDDSMRNERLIALFNQYFQDDYYQTMQTYCSDCDKETLIERSQQAHDSTYTDRSSAVQQYLTFIYTLLTQTGHQQEAAALELFAQSHLFITHEEGIS
jgi:cytochrome c1